MMTALESRILKVLKDLSHLPHEKLERSTLCVELEDIASLESKKLKLLLIQTANFFAIYFKLFMMFLFNEKKNNFTVIF